MRRLLCFTAGVAFLFALGINAQDNPAPVSKNHYFTFKTQFIQIQDDFTYGLVFEGINLMAGYEFIRESEKHAFTYSPEIGFGGIFNKGAGFAWRFKPVDVFYGFRIASQSNNKGFNHIGAYFAADYQWQQYPELQGGHLYWFTALELGPRISYSLPLKSKEIHITFSTSLAGFTSRPEPSTETYFYSFGLSEFVSSAHRNMQFGSFNLFNRTRFDIELAKMKAGRFSLTYGFEYFGYHQEPRLNFMNHSLKLKIKIGKL
jgi:hypothetical protein